MLAALQYAPVVVKVWTDRIFSPSTFPIEALQQVLVDVDFAALVLSPDDEVVSRGMTSYAPRDNVIFELGLFMGALGHARTFLTHPRNVDTKVPTDVVGITPLTYDSEFRGDTLAAMAPACDELRGQYCLTDLVEHALGKSTLALGVNLRSQVGQIVQERWSTQSRRSAPRLDDLELGSDAVIIEGRVLYADLNDSTGLVDSNAPAFAAAVYKSYLACAARIIRSENGTISAYDGDRIMAVYTGGRKADRAVLATLKINYAVEEIVNPAIRRRYLGSGYSVKHVVGIDTSELFVARVGVRGFNELVWVGRATNHAAKLSARGGPPSQITSEVYDQLSRESMFGDCGRPMWTRTTAPELGYRGMYTSSGWRRE